MEYTLNKLTYINKDLFIYSTPAFVANIEDKKERLNALVELCNIGLSLDWDNNYIEVTRYKDSENVEVKSIEVVNKEEPKNESRVGYDV